VGIGEAEPAGDWPRRLAGRAAWRRHCPSGEGARHRVRQWRRFGNGLAAALEFYAVRAFMRSTGVNGTNLQKHRRRPVKGACVECCVVAGGRAIRT
jgi:hypothetical protein